MPERRRPPEPNINGASEEQFGSHESDFWKRVENIGKASSASPSSSILSPSSVNQLVSSSESRHSISSSSLRADDSSRLQAVKEQSRLIGRGAEQVFVRGTEPLAGQESEAFVGRSVTQFVERGGSVELTGRGLEQFSRHEMDHVMGRGNELLTGYKPELVIGYQSGHLVGRDTERFSGDSSVEFVRRAGEQLIGRGSERLIGRGSEHFIGRGSEQLISGNSDQQIGRGSEQFIGRGSKQFIGQGSEQFIGQGSEQFIGRGSEQLSSRNSKQLISRGSEQFIRQGSERQTRQESQLLIGQESEHFIGRGSDQPIGRGSEQPIGRSSEQLIGRGSEPLIGRVSELHIRQGLNQTIMNEKEQILRHGTNQFMVERMEQVLGKESEVIVKQELQDSVNNSHVFKTQPRVHDIVSRNFEPKLFDNRPQIINKNNSTYSSQQQCSNKFNNKFNIIESHLNAHPGHTVQIPESLQYPVDVPEGHRRTDNNHHLQTYSPRDMSKEQEACPPRDMCPPVLADGSVDLRKPKDNVPGNSDSLGIKVFDNTSWNSDRGNRGNGSTNGWNNVPNIISTIELQPRLGAHSSTDLRPSLGVCPPKNLPQMNFLQPSLMPPTFSTEQPFTLQRWCSEVSANIPVPTEAASIRKVLSKASKRSSSEYDATANRDDIFKVSFAGFEHTGQDQLVVEKSNSNGKSFLIESNRNSRLGDALRYPPASNIEDFPPRVSHRVSHRVNTDSGNCSNNGHSGIRGQEIIYRHSAPNEQGVSQGEKWKGRQAIPVEQTKPPQQLPFTPQSKYFPPRKPNNNHGIAYPNGYLPVNNNIVAYLQHQMSMFYPMDDPRCSQGVLQLMSSSTQNVSDAVLSNQAVNTPNVQRASGVEGYRQNVSQGLKGAHRYDAPAIENSLSGQSSNPFTSSIVEFNHSIEGHVQNNSSRIWRPTLNVDQSPSDASSSTSSTHLQLPPHLDRLHPPPIRSSPISARVRRLPPAPCPERRVEELVPFVASSARDLQQIEVTPTSVLRSSQNRVKNENGKRYTDPLTDSDRVELEKLYGWMMGEDAAGGNSGGEGNRSSKSFPCSTSVKSNMESALFRCGKLFIYYLFVSSMTFLQTGCPARVQPVLLLRSVYFLQLLLYFLGT